MNKIFVHLFILWTALSLNAMGQEKGEINRLMELINKKVQHDAIEQDSNLILFTLKLNVDKNSLRNKTEMQLLGDNLFTTSTRFCYMKGFNLRFYVLSSVLFSNDARLEIYRSGEFDELPLVCNISDVKFSKEIIDYSSDEVITYFDYKLKHYEEFKLVFSLKERKPGAGVVVVTVYPQKD